MTQGRYVYLVTTRQVLSQPEIGLRITDKRNYSATKQDKLTVLHANQTPLRGSGPASVVVRHRSGD